MEEETADGLHDPDDDLDDAQMLETAEGLEEVKEHYAELQELRKRRSEEEAQIEAKRRAMGDIDKRMADITTTVRKAIRPRKPARPTPYGDGNGPLRNEEQAKELAKHAEAAAQEAAKSGLQG